MAFLRKKYETDDGVVVGIRLTPESFSRAGAEPAGDLEQTGWLISVGGSRRSQTRRIARAWIYSNTETVEGRPSSVKYLRVPKLTKAAYDAAPGAPIVIEEDSYVFLTKSPEG